MTHPFGLALAQRAVAKLALPAFARAERVTLLHDALWLFTAGCEPRCHEERR